MNMPFHSLPRLTALRKFGNAIAEATRLPISATPRAGLLATMFVVLLFLAIPALAQSPPAGPVHFPAGYATNAPAQYPRLFRFLHLATPAATSAPRLPCAEHGLRPRTFTIFADRFPFPTNGSGRLISPAGWSSSRVLYALWRLFRRKAAVKPKLPFEIALERLEAARALMTRDPVREYAFTVSEIIRVLHRATFRRKGGASHHGGISVRSAPPNRDAARRGIRTRLKDFLNHCDLSKFARWQFSVREMESMHEKRPRSSFLKHGPSPNRRKSGPSGSRRPNPNSSKPNDPFSPSPIIVAAAAPAGHRVLAGTQGPRGRGRIFQRSGRARSGAGNAQPRRAHRCCCCRFSPPRFFIIGLARPQLHAGHDGSRGQRHRYHAGHRRFRLDAVARLQGERPADQPGRYRQGGGLEIHRCASGRPAWA